MILPVSQQNRSFYTSVVTHLKLNLMFNYLLTHIKIDMSVHGMHDPFEIQKKKSQRNYSMH